MGSEMYIRDRSICFVLYLVVYGFGRYFLLVFGLYLLFQFFTTSFISLYSTIMRTCLRRSIYSYVQTMHVSLRLLYYLSVDSSQFVKLSLYFGKCRSVCLSVRIPSIPRRDSRQVFNFGSLAVDPRRHRVPLALTQTLGLSQARPPAVPCVLTSHI